jgi:hypothetical protein
MNSLGNKTAALVYKAFKHFIFVSWLRTRIRIRSIFDHWIRIRIRIKAKLQKLYRLKRFKTEPWRAVDDGGVEAPNGDLEGQIHRPKSQIPITLIRIGIRIGSLIRIKMKCRIQIRIRSKVKSLIRIRASVILLCF